MTFGTYPDNIGHMTSQGCFGCHDGSHTAKDGTTINADCSTLSQADRKALTFPAPQRPSPASGSPDGQLLRTIPDEPVSTVARTCRRASFPAPRRDAHECAGAGGAKSRCPSRPPSPDPLVRMNESIDALTKKVWPSVVQILVSSYGARPEGGPGEANVVVGRQRSVGSGFVDRSRGYILTNAHVVSGARRVQIVLPADNADGTLATALSEDRRSSPRASSASPPNSTWRC